MRRSAKACPFSCGKARLFALLALLALAGGAVGWMLTRPEPLPPQGVRTGFTAPNFSLLSLDGQRVALSDYRGRTVLLLFWQSTCPDCAKAMPEVRALWQKYRPRGVVLLGVNLDHDPEAAVAYLRAHGYTDQITLWESFDAAMDVVSLFEVPYVPYLLVIDKRGVIRFHGVYPALPRPEELEKWL